MRAGAVLAVLCLIGGCSSESDDADRIAELESQLAELTATTAEPVETTPSVDSAAPTTTEIDASLGTTSDPPATSVQPSTTAAVSTQPTTTISSQEQDAAVVRRLIYEQQQFARDFARRGNWTADDYIEWLSYHYDRVEPTFGAAWKATCTNWEELARSDWSQVPDSAEASYFELWALDLDTLEPDPSWVTELPTGPVGPFDGRTYIITVTFEVFDGSTRTQDVHVAVNDDAAYWFVNYNHADCQLA